jgi:four helix bundle protein
MRLYRLACELVHDAWTDAEKLKHDKVTEGIDSQLYRAVGSIAANLAEGYGHSSGRDRARIFEYALGSARESMVWYQAAVPVLKGDDVGLRVNKLEEIRRMLIAIIPRERGRLIRPRNP